MSFHSNGGSPGLEPEARFLLAACSVNPEAARATAEELLAATLDADVLGAAAGLNRVIPLTYDLLRAGGGADRSPYLHGFARQIRWRNMFMIEELLQVTRHLEEQGLEIMVYKGPVLAHLLYDDHSQRMYHDLDVIVREQDVPQALDLLQRRGFEPDPKVGPLTPARLEAFVRCDCQLRLSRRTPDILLELHWHVFPRKHRGRIDMTELWERSVSIDFPGRSVRTLSPEDTLVTLASHGRDKHHWERLQMVADVARFVARNPDLDWPALHERALLMDRERAVLEALGLAWLLLDAELPPALAARVRQPRTLAAAAAAMGYQFRPDRGYPRYAEWKTYVGALAEHAAERGQPVDGSPRWARYVAGAVSLRWEDQPLHLPPALSFAYYLYRPLRLLAKHGKGLLKRV